MILDIVSTTGNYTSIYLFVIPTPQWRDVTQSRFHVGHSSACSLDMANNCPSAATVDCLGIDINTDPPSFISMWWGTTAASCCPESGTSQYFLAALSPLTETQLRNANSTSSTSTMTFTRHPTVTRCDTRSLLMWDARARASWSGPKIAQPLQLSNEEYDINDKGNGRKWRLWKKKKIDSNWSFLG